MNRVVTQERDDWDDWTLQIANDDLHVELKGWRHPLERAPRYVPNPVRREEMIALGHKPLTEDELMEMRGLMTTAIVRSPHHDWSHGWHPVDDGFTHYMVICKKCKVRMRLTYGRGGECSFLQLYGPQSCY